MDEAKRQLSRSVFEARKLYQRTELRQRQRVQRLQLRIERRTSRALQSVRELLDFDPTRDLNACLGLTYPAEESRAPKPAGRPASAQPVGKKPAINRREPHVGTSTGRVMGASGTHPAGKKRPAAGKTESHRKPPGLGSRFTLTSEAPVSRIADGLTTKLPRTGANFRDPQHRKTDQKTAVVAGAAANQARHDAPLSESTTKERKTKPSLAERRRQWARSRRDDHTNQQPGPDFKEKRIEKTAPDGTGSFPESGLPSVRDKPRRAASATAATIHRGRRSTIETDVDPRPPVTSDPQTVTTTARAGVQIDPIETASVTPADERQAPSQPGEAGNLASRRDEIELARELAEAVYLHGIDRT